MMMWGGLDMSGGNAGIERQGRGEGNSPLSHSVILYCRGLLEEEEVEA